MTIKLQGEAEFHAAVQRLVKSVKPDRIEPVIFRAAAIVTRQSKQLAPQRPTGRLHRSIRTRKLQRLFGRPAPAVSAIDRRKAPHAYLVHDWALDYRPPKERVGQKGYRPYRGKRFGRMPENPFHTQAWEMTQGKALNYIETNVKKMVEGAASRGT
jgi:hypothetical protein